MIEQFGVLEVAVKYIHGDINRDKIVVESFKYEVSIMASLPESPYLVKMIGYCTNPMTIVMKYYPLNLAESFLTLNFIKTREERLKCSLEVAMGMALIHSKDIIHFDLKPGTPLSLKALLIK